MLGGTLQRNRERREGRRERGGERSENMNM